jgi:hypothetical protein
VCLVSSAALVAQTAPAPPAPAAPAQADTAGPIAIVPLNGEGADAATVTGALEVTSGKAMIGASGSVTSGSRTTSVILPHRGVLRVCATTTVKLASDPSVPAGESPGLLIAMDHGAIETSFATGRNADVLLTPDFRILIGGPGASELKVRLGRDGDTCVDNSGANAPYVVVTSLFDSGLYRVQPGQHVMFQHGSLHEVVDQETEPCGCPPASAASTGKEFPLAQSEGLAPTPAPALPPTQPGTAAAQTAPPLVTASTANAPQAAPSQPPNPVQPAVSTAAAIPPSQPAKKKKPGFFARLGHFFGKIFGAES